MEKDVEEKVSYAKQKVATTIVDSFRNSVADARDPKIGNKTAAEAAEIVFAKSAANRDFIGLSGQEQNDTVFRLAEEYALQGDEEMARALLEGNRTGADGKALPALVKISGYTDKALRLLEQAGGMHDQKVKETGRKVFNEVDGKVLRGAFTEADMEELAGTGYYSDKELTNELDRSKRNKLAMEAKAEAERQRREFPRASTLEEQRVYSQASSLMNRFGGVNVLRDIEIPNQSGDGTRTVSRQMQIDNEVERKEEEFTEFQETQIAKGVDAPTARAEANRMRIDWYAGNGIVNEDWSNTLNGIAGRATPDTLLQEGEVPEYFKASAGVYRQLKAVNSPYLSTILKDKASKEFLETYDRAVSQRKMPEDEALQYAAQRTSRTEGEKARDMIGLADAEKLAERTLKSLGLDRRSSNYAYVMERIESLSKNEATEGEIKNALESDLLETAVPINGMLVFANNDLPKDFPELMELELQKRFEDYGERYGIEDVSDLYLVASGISAASPCRCYRWAPRRSLDSPLKGTGRPSARRMRSRYVRCPTQRTASGPSTRRRTTPV